MLLAACGNSTKEQTTTTADSDSVKSVESRHSNRDADLDICRLHCRRRRDISHSSAQSHILYWKTDGFAAAQRHCDRHHGRQDSFHTAHAWAFVSRGSVIAVIDNPCLHRPAKGFTESRAQLAYLESEYNRQAD